MSHLSSHCIATMYQDGDGRILQLICSSHVGGHQWSSIFRNSPNGKNLINTQYASNDKMQLMHKSTLSNHTVAPWASIMANILFTEETVVVLLVVRSQKKTTTWCTQILNHPKYVSQEGHVPFSMHVHWNCCYHVWIRSYAHKTTTSVHFG